MEKPAKQKGVRHVDGYRDRIWISYGQKIQVSQYEPVSIQIGYATDIKTKEKISEAFIRAEKVVATRIRREINSLVKQKRKNKG